jgi:hypothetical protein
MQVPNPLHAATHAERLPQPGLLGARKKAIAVARPSILLFLLTRCSSRPLATYCPTSFNMAAL